MQRRAASRRTTASRRGGCERTRWMPGANDRFLPGADFRGGGVTKSYDAVIIGGGHNGLVCGAYLARAGKSVCVLERRPLIGGAAVTEELWPGFKVSTASYTMALLQPRIILELELAKHGFEVVKPTPMFHPMPGGPPILGYDELARTCA